MPVLNLPEHVERQVVVGLSSASSRQAASCRARADNVSIDAIPAVASPVAFR